MSYKSKNPDLEICATLWHEMFFRACLQSLKMSMNHCISGFRGSIFVQNPGITYGQANNTHIVKTSTMAASIHRKLSWTIYNVYKISWRSCQAKKGSLVISVILPQSHREHREKMIQLCALCDSVASIPFTEQRISREIPKSPKKLCALCKAKIWLKSNRLA